MARTPAPTASAPEAEPVPAAEILPFSAFERMRGRELGPVITEVVRVLAGTEKHTGDGWQARLDELMGATAAPSI